MQTSTVAYSHAETQFSPHPRIDAAIEAALDEQRLVGAVVLVAHNGELIYRRAAGFADREARRLMHDDALFRLASISKPIVSTAAMVLAGQGSLGLDDTVERWLPEFVPRLADGSAAAITVRQLLSHTAGLGYRFFETDENGPYARAGVSDGMDSSGITLGENLRRIADVPLLYAPGTAWGYSLATDVLGALIERVCRLPLGEAVHTLVTGPLALRDMDFVAVDPERLAVPYVNGSPGPLRMRDSDVVPVFDGTVGIRYQLSRALDAAAFPSGGAGMVGSAGDFLQILELLREGGRGLLPQSLVDEMGTVQTGSVDLPAAPGFGFGLGFSVLRDAAAAESPESPGTWRWGGAYGHSWFVDRTRGLSVVAFTNTLYEGMSGRFVADLRDAVYASLPALQAAQACV
ncbi:serine hydrolase domain-containing protein [Undibacterium sp.]|jgi:CubicO group peptidase (beta-lactamase class C family)|uniref:serine hydrolase domain-containing protein n=1 Tax=Undibacterium sp. TaxID=1914977 RepID=UPI002BD3F0A4|nr:serine hydrolase domain-containing protein [Undibacterium sp.]HTD05543.1 serine hydrolase domain-containing protein [Undibacterium sp.]